MGARMDIEDVNPSAAERLAMIAESVEVAPEVYRHSSGYFIARGPRGGSKLFKTEAGAREYMSRAPSKKTGKVRPKPVSGGSLNVIEETTPKRAAWLGPICILLLFVALLGAIYAFSPAPPPNSTIAATAPSAEQKPAAYNASDQSTARSTYSSHYSPYSCRSGTYDAYNCAQQRKDFGAIGNYVNGIR
jgi:hypothetical protein